MGVGGSDGAGVGGHGDTGSGATVGTSRTGYEVGCVVEGAGLPGKTLSTDGVVVGVVVEILGE